MSDDHQVLLVGGPWKSLVTFGDTSSPLRFAPTFTSGAGSVTRNPAPTFSDRAAGAAGSGRGAMGAGPHDASAAATNTTPSALIGRPTPCAGRRAPCACSF